MPLRVNRTRRREPSVLQFLAERLVASAAAVFTEVAKSRLDARLIAAFHSREEHVGLAHRVLLSIEKLVPIAPNSRFGRELAIGAGSARTRRKRVGYFSRRLGQRGRTCLGLRLVPLAIDVSLDTPDVLALPLHQGLAVLDDRFFVLGRRSTTGGGQRTDHRSGHHRALCRRSHLASRYIELNRVALVTAE